MISYRAFFFILVALEVARTTFPQPFQYVRALGERAGHETCVYIGMWECPTGGLQ
jgi:hypothetical protein